MASKSYVEFSASRREVPDASVTRSSAVSSTERIEVSVYLKPREDQARQRRPGANPRTDMQAQRSAQHAADIELIRSFAQDTGLSVVCVEPARRLVKLAGTARALEAAFKTKLSHYDDGAHKFRARTGALHLPSDLLPIVEAVLGLDTRPAAKPRLVVHPNARAAAAHLPNQVASLYGFPTAVDGHGQCIALIELGGGFTSADTKSAFKAMGLAPPAVVSVPVDGGANRPTPDDGADGEVALDIQVAGGAAPGAKIAVYFAPNTDAGFVDAITGAVHDASLNPSVISISWGSAESNWTQQAINAMNSALKDAATVGVSVFAASGDNLATDGVDDGKAHVDFPASSPWAIGCGGTEITVSGNAISRETVWNDGSSGTGGGISDVFPVPAFQKNTVLPPSVNDRQGGRRGVPDVAGNAAPDSGYRVIVNGQAEVVGGTSAVAPLWAGLAALINQKAAKPVGFFLPSVYQNPKLLNQITQGSNMPAGSSVGYEAGTGWNACTGLGAPKGGALFDALTGGDSTAGKR